MPVYSTKHEMTYAAMCGEMVKFAGFQDSVAARLRNWAAMEFVGDDAARSIDDLWDIYGGQAVME